MRIKQRVTVIDNSPEEVRDLVIEMLDRLDGTVVYGDGDVRRQEEFRALFRPGHYSFGSVALVGRDFLRQQMSPDAR